VTDSGAAPDAEASARLAALARESRQSACNLRGLAAIAKYPADAAALRAGAVQVDRSAEFLARIAAGRGGMARLVLEAFGGPPGAGTPAARPGEPAAEPPPGPRPG
jgi:hypothetical protein